MSQQRSQHAQLPSGWAFLVGLLLSICVFVHVCVPPQCCAFTKNTLECTVAANARSSNHVSQSWCGTTSKCLQSPA